MQTPNDEGLFCSLVIQTNGHSRMQEGDWITKLNPFNAILITSELDFHLSKTARPFTVPSEWTSNDLPMVFLPLEFLVRHVRLVSETLAGLTSEVSFVEDVVINDNDKTDFKSLIKRLHVCSRELVKLRRRWHFQITLAETILELIEIHDPVIAATRRDATDPPVIKGDIHVGSDSQVTFERGTVMGNIHVHDKGRFYSSLPQNIKEDPLTQSREYRQLLSAASLQLKLSKSLEYDLRVLPERIGNQFNAVSMSNDNICFDLA